MTDFVIRAVISCVTAEKSAEFEITAGVTDYELRELEALEPGTPLYYVESVYEGVEEFAFTEGMRMLIEKYPELEGIEDATYMIELFV